MQLVGESEGGTELIDYLLAQLATFTGPGWEQEDDVTLVALQRYEDRSMRGDFRSADSQATDRSGQTPNQSTPDERESSEDWKALDSFHVESKVGNERSVINRVTTAVSPLEISDRRLERLKTAVGEAAMNAMEHGNHYQPDIPIEVEVLASPTNIAVRISDQGGAPANFDPETPDLEAKLAGEQSPRGWGLYLIKNLVDEMHVTADGDHHTVELIVKR
jgi:anti-sigma regulatory factor (Ser/Thr protein kinase)